jgi:hypothetical protein
MAPITAPASRWSKFTRSIATKGSRSEKQRESPRASPGGFFVIRLHDLWLASPFVKDFWRSVAAGILTCVLVPETNASTVSAVTVSLAKAVADSRLIVVGRVEEISGYRFSNARKKMATTRYFSVRIEEVLKSRESAETKWNGHRISILDPQEMFYQEQADLIAAEAISFVDPQYPTRVRQIAVGDRLIFFLAGPEAATKLPLPDARFLICGHAYDTLAVKRAVLKQVK